MGKHHQKVLIFMLALVLLFAGIAIAISTNLSTTSGMEAAPEDVYEIVDSNITIYPGIRVTPQSLSFSADSSTRNWERIDICIYNHVDYHIINASIKLTIPKRWDFRFNTDPNTGFYYRETNNKKIFWIEDFGSYHENNTCDWFEIRQGSNISSGTYNLNAECDISYLYRAANITAVSTSQDIIPKCGNRSKNISLELTVEKEPQKESSDRMINVVITLIGTICTIILLIFGPGGRQRVENISGWIRRKK